MTRYIYLNPLRGGIVKRLADLRRYPWTGYAAGKGDCAGQATTTALAYFGPVRQRAIERYEAFVRESIP